MEKAAGSKRESVPDLHLAGSLSGKYETPDSTLFAASGESIKHAVRVERQISAETRNLEVQKRVPRRGIIKLPLHISSEEVVFPECKKRQFFVHRKKMGRSKSRLTVLLTMGLDSESHVAGNCEFSL